MSGAPIEGLVFIGLSLDGFIARQDGDIAWLIEGSAGISPADTGYEAFFDSVDAVVLGRGTYEVVAAFDEWPYGAKPVVVLSTTLGGDDGRIRVEPDIDGVLAALAETGARRVYVDGGATVQSFLRRGLIAEIVLTRIPVLIGQGIPLFGATGADVALEHLSTHVIAGSLVQSRYRVR